MIYRRPTRTSPGGFHRFQSESNQVLYGHGDGEYIRLRDEFGNVWRGSAEKDMDNFIRYRFRDEKGHSITGMADTYGIVLRDEKGKSWRGFVD